MCVCSFFDEPGKQLMRVLKDTKYDLEEMRKNEKLLSPPDGMCATLLHKLCF